MNCTDAGTLLHAYFDGELNAGDRSAVETHLSQCASCSQALARLQHLRQTIRAEVNYHRAPAALGAQIRSSLRAAERIEPAPRRFEWKTWGAIAAGIALAGGLFLARSNNEQQIVAEELFSAHARALMGREIDVESSDRHTVKPWFNGKLPFSPPVSDLSADGFPLEGGRLDFARGHAVAALVYRRNLHRIDVFVWPEADISSPPAQIDRNGFHEISWTHEGFRFAAISDLNVAELSNFVALLQTKAP